ADLREALHLIIRNHTVYPYGGHSISAADGLKDLDQDPANTNNVILVYSRRSEPKSTFGKVYGWNREHLWANSYGLDYRPPSFTDLHNLRAEDFSVNCARGNKFYDQSNTNDVKYHFPAHVEAAQVSADHDSWEPPDEVKGDIARSLFYMAVRYTGDITNEPALKITNETETITSTHTLMGRLDTLLRWHIEDPVDDRERLRNDRVYTNWQHNRNPFVDHPEYVVPIFDPENNVIIITE
ncbi:MAG: endonuclease, partial [Pseudomonadota bacterium]